ncbi:MAG: TIR domain-containing protein, partial [Bacteroidota bacterium]
MLQEIMDQAADVPPEDSLAAHNLRIFQLVNHLQLAKDKDQKEALQKEIKELEEEFPVQEDAVLKVEVDKAIQDIPAVNWWSVAMDFFRSYLTSFAQNPEQSEIPLTGLIYTYSNRELENAVEALYPFFTLPYLKQVSEDYIPTYLQKFSPSSFVQLSGASESGERQEAISTFLRIFEKSETAQERRLEYLILGGTGMGKTTFLLNLFLAHLKRKQSREDALEIRFIPLRDPKIFDLIQEVPQPRRTILLLDGLDEASGAVQNAQTYIQRILEITQIFPIVIFSCRTQFFASEQDKLLEMWENTQSAQGTSWSKLYLSPLTEKEIYAYIDKKYDLLEQGKRTKAQKIIEIAPDSMSRQMILGYLDEMIEEDLDEAKLIGLFHWIIQRWLGRQAARIPQDRQEQFKEGLWEFSIEATLEMYQNRRMFISSQEIEDLAARNQFGLSLHEMRTRSLLNRNKEGVFKFAHQSFFEYFLATAAATNRKIVGKFAPKEFPLAQKFYQEMIDEEIQATFKQGTVDNTFEKYQYEDEHTLASEDKIRPGEVDKLKEEKRFPSRLKLRLEQEIRDSVNSKLSVKLDELRSYISTSSRFWSSFSDLSKRIRAMDETDITEALVESYNKEYEVVKGSILYLLEQLSEKDLYTFDFFISYVARDFYSYDGPNVAEQLIQKLELEGAKVWVDKNEILVGESISEKINEGIRNARHAVIVISPAYLELYFRSPKVRPL